MKKRWMSMLLTLCMVLCLAPTAAWAAPGCSQAADFTAVDGGAAALALLNRAKTGATNSAWDNDTKTLTLRGVDFATTAPTAVKLPAGATVVLADGTENKITGGDTTASQDGGYTHPIYTYGIYAAGALTVQGETKGTGALTVYAGAHTNSGNAWTYSAGIYADGDLTVKGGQVTAQGGEAVCGNCAFSCGVQLADGGRLAVTGGTLTGIGGRSRDAEDPNDVDPSFSMGVYTNGGGVAVSGSGRLIACVVEDMAKTGLSFGLYVLNGKLLVADSAFVSATAAKGIYVSNGEIQLSGGKIAAVATDGESMRDAVQVIKDDIMDTTSTGNITVTGGELTCKGCLYMSNYQTGAGQGVLSITGGQVTADRIEGARQFFLSNGTVTSGRILAKAVTIQSGRLTVREPVRRNAQASLGIYAYYALNCTSLTVSGGTLDAAWVWGDLTPMVFPAASWNDDLQLLLNLNGGTATFSGGTVLLDTGCAGNTALQAGTLSLSGGVRGSGFTHTDGSDIYIQQDSATPVKFAVYPADYSKVDAALDQVQTLDKNLYKDFSAVDTAVHAVVRGKNIDEQAAVDRMARAIEDAITALEYKDADYSRVDEAIAKANALNREDYKDLSAVDTAIDAVVRGKNITEQAVVDDMARAIEAAIGNLEKTPAVPQPGPDEPPTKPNEPTTAPHDPPSQPAQPSAPNRTHQAQTPAQSPTVGTKSPQTGAADPALRWLAPLFAGGACILLWIKRKKAIYTEVM